jgi:hypothetical protein
MQMADLEKAKVKANVRAARLYRAEKWQVGCLKELFF